MISSPRFWDDVERYRSVYLGGEKGTGKTLLATCIAEFYWRRGYRIYANYPLLFNSPLTPDLIGNELLKKAVIILDEAGSRYLNARKWGSQSNQAFLAMTDYARHQDLIFVFPTASQVDKGARRLSLARNLAVDMMLMPFALNSLIWHYFVWPIQSKPYGVFMLAPYAYWDCYSGNDNLIGAYGDGLALLLVELQEKILFNAEKAQAAAADIKRVLSEGGVYPPLLPKKSRFLVNSRGDPRGGSQRGATREAAKNSVPFLRRLLSFLGGAE